MTLGGTWPACRLCCASTRVWRGTWRPWRTRWGDSYTCTTHTHTHTTLTPSSPQVNTLGGDAERLQQTHPHNAAQIHLKKDELVANWEQIRTLAAERHAHLNDSYR